MPIIDLPGSLQLHIPAIDAERVRRKFAARLEFSRDYCRRHAWPEDPDELSVSQIMEIRSEDGWKDAGS